MCVKLSNPAKSVISQRSPKSKGSAAPAEPSEQGYNPPPLDDMFDGNRPKWGATYDKFIASTLVPSKFPENGYYDAKADAVIAEEYFKGVTGLAPSERTQALRKLVGESHVPHPRGYDYVVAEHLYTTVDRHPDGAVKSLYDAEPVKSLQYPNVDLSTLETNDLESIAGAMSASPEVIASWLAFKRGKQKLNCEHVVPQSYFGKQEPMRSDLHHLYACDMKENSARGSTKLVNFVPSGGKGEAARATLYFMLRYPDVKTPYTEQDVATLKDWAKQDPPSLREQRRNHEIQKIQGNRNPFIDHPEWLDDFTP